MDDVVMVQEFGEGAGMLEIPNVEIVRNLVGNVRPDADHSGLGAALAARYPGFRWHVSHFPETWFRPLNQVVDADNRIVAPDCQKWLKQQLAEAGGNPVEVWRQHHNSGLATVEEQGTTLFIAAPVGRRAEDFIQLRLEHIVGARLRAVFEDRAPQEVDDLFPPCFFDSVERQWSAAPRYDLDRMDWIARTLVSAEDLEMERRRQWDASHRLVVSEVGSGTAGSRQQEKRVTEVDPDYLSRPINERRFVSDWASSSAGDKLFCGHWACDVRDYVYEGRRHLGFCPRPLAWGADIAADSNRSLFSLMDELDRFDAEAGYPMAWYFHALYGSRLGGWAIEQVHEGLRKGRIALPEGDATIIRQWVKSPYGF